MVLQLHSTSRHPISMKKTITSLVAAMCALTLSNCAQQGLYHQNNMTRGATTGAAVGALAGGILGNQSDHAGEGILLGAALGGLAGAAIGDNQDRQQRTATQYYQQGY